MDSLNIVKKDGSVEGWNKDKLIASIGKSGVDVKGAQEIYDKALDWAVAAQKEAKVSSNELRDKIIEFMKEDYPAEADNYQTYKKE